MISNAEFQAAKNAFRFIKAQSKKSPGKYPAARATLTELLCSLRKRSYTWEYDQIILTTVEKTHVKTLTKNWIQKSMETGLRNISNYLYKR